MTDRALIITGGTGGLGTEVVRRLMRDYRCVVLFHGSSSYDALRRELGEPDAVTGVQCDLGDESSIRAAIAAAVDSSGAPYGLVHLAGGFAAGRVAETSTDTWNQQMALNLTSAFFVIREVLPRMKRPGRIVAIASEAAALRNPGIAAYTVAKAGLTVLIELTAAELRGSGITANALLPGSLDTPAMRTSSDRKTLVPLDRVAESIAFLLSDAGGSVNGALIRLEP